jgi:hypothetical protein
MPEKGVNYPFDIIEFINGEVFLDGLIEGFFPLV